jgi:signal transduction histidine kinase
VPLSIPPFVRRSRLVLGTGLVAAIVLAWESWMDVRSGTLTAERLMHAQARSIADLVGEIGTHGFENYRRWEDEVAARLFDNARWVARRESVRPWTDVELAAFAKDHDLGRVNLFDARGDKVATSRLEPEESLQPRHDPRDFIAPILRGETRELRIGFKEARFRGGLRFSVAVARRGGGAVVVNVFADSMRASLETVQPAHLIRALGGASGVRYVALQAGDSLLASTSDSIAVGSLPPLAPGAAETSREIATGAGSVYEVTRALALPEIGPVTLRIGLDPAPLVRARADLRRRAIVRALMLAATFGLAGTLLLAWQRQRVLAEEVARVKADLERRSIEAQRSARLAAMGELAAHVAHEIRNPLNTIHLTAQEMVRDGGSGTDLRARAEDLRSESRRIEGIVQQFLELARPRTPQPRELELGERVRAVARAAEPAFRAAGVRLRVDAEAVTLALDPQFVEEIVDNLLRNAREASPPGGEVSIAVRRAAGEAQIVVEDEGPGVREEMRERVFDLFYTDKPRGSGLGLGIVSTLAAAMGGGVQLTGREAGGARFVVHFPRGERK